MDGRGHGARFVGLVHHTDAEREWSYDRTSSVGQLDKALRGQGQELDNRGYETRLEDHFPAARRALTGRSSGDFAASSPQSSERYLVQTQQRHARRKRMPKLSTLGRWMLCLGAAALVFALATVGLHEAQAQDKKLNILVIFGDDIGQSNISAYSKGVMGYKTLNIDRLASEGMIFTDYYAEQSCTAGRSTLIHRPGIVAHRAEQGRGTGCPDRATEGRPDDRRVAQTTRVCDRPIREESSWGQGRVPAQ